MNMITTMDVANVQQVLAHSFDDWGKSPVMAKGAAPLTGYAVFTTNGAVWKHAREVIKPSFARSEIAILDSFYTHVNAMFDLLPTDGSTVNLQTFLNKLVR